MKNLFSSALAFVLVVAAVPIMWGVLIVEAIWKLGKGGKRGGQD